MKIAYLNKIGILMMMSTQRNSCLTFDPYGISILLPKKLYAATSVVNINEGSNVFMTSADSDLDFVYYK